jgi:hypothetical protein
MLPNFYQSFLHLKAQALNVFDDQVIAQAIKVFWAKPLHSHLVREKQKTTVEIYENFTKLRKLEVLHFHKLEQQKKAPKHDKASRQAHYS